MAAIVLVHGAWHGAWCWYKVKTELERRGHWVVAPDLAGHGADRTPNANIAIDAYIQPVLDALASAPEPPLLVGHSMGGMIISMAAERTSTRLASLIYLCAFLPQDGESLMDLVTRDAHSKLLSYIDFATNTVRDEGLVPCFYADCSTEDVTLARMLLQPQTQAPTTTKASLTAARFGAISRRYVVCAQDQAISAEHQRWMAARYPDMPVMEMNTSHSPFFSAPALLADAIVGK